ncbi:hypothetical protein B0T44_16410 [Nocardia donostiensis]|uniref:Uncharacterized protein n=1 Tax=Nocardia donostiensis TaxID=1538463 RepID=A0A1W0B981_9NOCA|nr:hypothetical protein B0T46_22125 [Nocardia donostiensis]OQS19055.1 hypothetical protein B0T44_16410 [Nocardia donostiensis]
MPAHRTSPIRGPPLVSTFAQPPPATRLPTAPAPTAPAVPAPADPLTQPVRLRPGSRFSPRSWERRGGRTSDPRWERRGGRTSDPRACAEGASRDG